MSRFTRCVPWLYGLLLVLAWSPGHAESSGQAEDTLDAVPPRWPIQIAMQPLLLDGEEPRRRELGSLTYLAGYALTSPEPAFGGFSGLACPGGDRLLAVSDRGHWLAVDLDLDAEGRLKRLQGAKMGPLLDDDGQPVQGRARRDAEDMTSGPSGGFLVSFEGTHRIEIYGAGGDPEDEGLQGLPRPFPSPKSIDESGHNAGLEAMTWLQDGRLLLLTEGLRQQDGTLRGWVGTPLETAPSNDHPMRYETLSLQPLGPFQPTAATTLPQGGPWAGDVVFLQRHYTPETGTRVGVFRLAADAIDPGVTLRGEPLAHFEGSLTVDNFEGLTACTQDSGRTVLYLISDDNFNQTQRTLLLQFALTPPPATPSSTRPE